MSYATWHNFRCDRGATFNEVVYWYDDAGAAIALSGYVADFVVSATWFGASIVALTQGSGITLHASNGSITIRIEEAATAALTAGDYYYYLELDDGVTATRLLEGAFIIK